MPDSNPVATIARPLRAVARRAGVDRARVAAWRMQAEREFLAVTAPRRRPPAGRILCYHSVGTAEWGVNDVTPERLEHQIQFALQSGYSFVPATKVAAGEASADELAVTFDDGLISVAANAAPILDEYDVPWTLFVVTDWADGRHGFGGGVLMGWNDIERLAAQGVEIGSHSVSHPDFGSLTPERARWELLESRRVIEARTGLSVSAFAIPMGQSNNWSDGAAAAAQEVGYELVYSQSVDRRPRATIPRTFITSFDDRRLFAAALRGAFDDWEEWL